jgi:ADP-ribose pyrophosphatase YjhB (NUDIX family)
LERDLDSERKHWVSVAAAIVKGDQALAIRRRDNNKWEPPGGTLEPDESLLDGLRREVSEETGVAIGEATLTGVYKNMKQGIVALVFRCENGETEPRTSNEVAETRWMTPEEIRKQMDPAYACRLLDALNGDGVAVRSHDGVNLIEEI